MFAPSEASPHRRYRLIAEIGRGGMAEVYLAVAQGPGGFNKLVVVKKALRDLALQPEILSMFVDEARLAARMNHPNVVQTYELGEEGGRHYIAMEYLDGQPYSRVLTRLRNHPGGLEAMSLAHHLRVLADTLAGLHHAHELKDFDGSPLHVVHRDVSPQNVFVTYDGSIKVVDFGIAKAQDSSSRTMTGEIKGKVTYMSPEQMRGEPLDRRSDVFAVGVMLWEAVAGRRMWKDLPDARVVGELLLGHVPSIREVVPNVPAEFERILGCALHPDREARYPSALAMQRELEAYAMASGARVDGPEVGRVVSEFFVEERQRVREIVEAQLGSLRWTGENPAASSLPVIPSPAGSMRGGDWPGSDLRRFESGRPVGSQPGLPTNSGAALPLTAPLAAPRRSILWPVVGVALAALLGGAVAVGFVRASGTSTERAEASAAPLGPGASPQASISASAEAAKPESVSLKVRVTPPEAKIFLDGILLGAGSFDGRVVHSESERVLRVEAEGFQTKEEKLSLSSDLMTSLALEKLEPVAPAGPGSGSFKPGVPRTRHTGRAIDSESPYGTP